MKRLTTFGIILGLKLIAQATAQCDDGAEPSNDTNTDIDDGPKPSIIADVVVYNLITRVLHVSIDKHERLQKLQDKLKTIYNYEVNMEKFTEVLHNESKAAKFNHTSFYQALNEKDNLNFLTQKNPKNVYTQVRQKMNRNDILTVLGKNKIASNKKLLHTLDKIMIEPHENKYKYNSSNYTSMYWDSTANMQQEMSGRRIFKGSRTYIKYYPFIASIHVMGRFFCGGSIIYNDMVLTSAACLQLMHNNRFYREIPYVLQIRIGSNFSRIGGEKVEASEVFFHPNYNPRTLDHNVALIRLSRNIVFKRYRVPKAIEMSYSKKRVPNEIQVRLLGWGLTRVSSRLRYEPVYLQQKLVPIYPSLMCREIYGDKFKADRMFCAGSISVGDGACEVFHSHNNYLLNLMALVTISSPVQRNWEKYWRLLRDHTCISSAQFIAHTSQHDAGGPAVFNGYLLGVISYGSIVCGSPNSPTVFTHVGYYADWINQTRASIPKYYSHYVRTTITVPFDSTTKNLEKTTPPTTEALLPPLRMPTPIPGDDEKQDNKNEVMEEYKDNEETTTKSFRAKPLAIKQYWSTKTYEEKKSKKKQRSSEDQESDKDYQEIHDHNSGEGYRSEKVYRSGENYRSQEGYRSNRYKIEEGYKTGETYRSGEGYRTEERFRSGEQYRSKEGYRSREQFGSDRYMSIEGRESNPEFLANQRYRSKERYKSSDRYGSKKRYYSNENGGRYESKHRSKVVHKTIKSSKKGEKRIKSRIFNERPQRNQPRNEDNSNEFHFQFAT